MNDQLTPPEEEQQSTQDQPQHLGPRFDYSPVGEMPQQPAQPQPSKTRFRDAARELTPSAINRDVRDGLRDALPQTAEIVDNVRKRERGSDPSDFIKAANNPDRADAKQQAIDAAKDIPRKTAQASVTNAKKVGTLAKNKKWFIAGGTGIALMIPIAMFIVWMMLFKNVHIKNLYVTYRWAQFNRGVNRAVKDQIRQAKAKPTEMAPEGTAETAVNPTDPIESLSEKTNKAGFDPDTVDADKVAKDLGELERSKAGASEQAFKKADVGRTIDPVEGVGDTPEAIAEDARSKTKEAIKDDVGDGRKLEGAPDTLDPGLEEADKAAKEGASPREAAKRGASKIFESTGWKSAMQKAQGIFLISTFYCIFHDVYTSGKAQINQIVIGGAMAFSQETNKTADCAQDGDANCDATRNGAVAEQYDDGEKSFTQSCGYTRATQTDNPACEEIDPQFVVDGLAKEVAKYAGSSGSTAIKTADLFLDPPKLEVGPIKADVSTICSAVLSPAAQGSMTIIGLILLYTSGGGWGEVGVVVAQGVGAYAATTGGKALIASAILKYSGGLYKDLNPIDAGNVTDMGNAATASASCGAAYCPLASDAEVARLDMDYRKERIAANSKRSILEKFFDTESSDSVISRVALNSPSTPKAALGRMKVVFASIANPIRLTKSLGKNALALAHTDTAYAADNGAGAEAYGLSNKVAVPPNLLPGASSYESVLAWGKTADLAGLGSKYDKCATDAYSDVISTDDTPCYWDTMPADGRMYMQYKYYQNVAYKNALLHNNQTSVGGSSVPTSASTTSATPGVDTADLTCPAGTIDNGPVKTFTSRIRLCDVGQGTQINASAAKAYYDMILAAKADGVNLYGGGFRDAAQQIALRRRNCPDWVNSPPGDCSPPTAKPGTSRHEQGLAVDFKNASSRGTAVYQWLAANAGRFGIKNLPSESWHWSVDGK